MTISTPQLEGATPVDRISQAAAVVNSRTGREVQIPDEFVCPITQCVMVHPLLSKRGFHNFERAAILQWLGQSDLCPVTRQPLKPRELFPNRNLELRIKCWRMENDIETPTDDECQSQKYGITFLDVRTEQQKTAMCTPFRSPHQPITLASAILASAGAVPLTATTSIALSKHNLRVKTAGGGAT